jgi:hypothetical protein
MRNRLCLPLFCAALAAAPVLAHAQYKWLGPDGRVNYTDTPPPADATLASKRPLAAADAEGDPTLPFALRTLAQRHPVVLYSMPRCTPCDQARSHLLRRGIPFAEKVVATQNDATAFRTLGFSDLSFPALSVGRQRSSGFEADSWNRLLDAAGYPKTSLLTASYRHPPAEPMAPEPQHAAPAAQTAERDAVQSPRPQARPAPQASVPAPPPTQRPTIRF